MASSGSSSRSHYKPVEVDEDGGQDHPIKLEEIQQPPISYTKFPSSSSREKLLKYEGESHREEGDDSNEENDELYEGESNDGGKYTREEAAEEEDIDALSDLLKLTKNRQLLSKVRRKRSLLLAAAFNRTSLLSIAAITLLSLLLATLILSRKASAKKINGSVVVDKIQLTNTTAFHSAPEEFLRRTEGEDGSPRVREYDFTISSIWSNPAGIWKEMVAINGQSPAPPIFAYMNDTLRITVHNTMAVPSGLHYHGLFMTGKNFYDGTFSITGCGIPPGEKFTYEFIVENVGTYWYHGHHHLQSSEGLFGPLILFPSRTLSLPTGAPHHEVLSSQNEDKMAYQRDIILLLGDVYNTDVKVLMRRYNEHGRGMDGQPGDEPVPDAGHINGISQGRCAYTPASDEKIVERRLSYSLRSSPASISLSRRNPGDASKFDPPKPWNLTCAQEDLSETQRDALKVYWNATATPGETVRLRVVNSATGNAIRFAVDGHSLTIVEADGEYVEPVVVQSVVIGVGQRYSILITASEPLSSSPFWIRSEIVDSMLRYNSLALSERTTYGILYYAGGEMGGIPREEGEPAIADMRGHRESLDPRGDLHPLVTEEIPDATKTVTVVISQQYIMTGDYLAFVNDISFEPLNYGQSSLFQVEGTSDDDISLAAAHQPLVGHKDWMPFGLESMVIVNDKEEVLDIYLDNYDDGDHPWHLHGHAFWVISTGPGRYQPGISPVNTVNPVKRDTLILPTYSFAVIRFRTTNPGVWALHCHITWHVEHGMFLQVANVQKEGFRKMVGSIPEVMREQCKTVGSLGLERGY